MVGEVSGQSTALTAKEGRDRRAVHRLFGRWQAACGERPFPVRLNRQDVGEEALWDSLFSVDVGGRYASYRIEHFGRGLKAVLGSEYIGRPLRDLPEQFAQTAADLCFAAVSAGKPVSRSDDRFYVADNLFRYRMILLPVGRRERRPEMLVGTLGFIRCDLLGMAASGARSGTASETRH